MEMSASAPFRVCKACRGEVGELSGQLQIREQILTHPLTLIPGQTAYHVVLI